MVVPCPFYAAPKRLFVKGPAAGGPCYGKGRWNISRIADKENIRGQPSVALLPPDTTVTF